MDRKISAPSHSKDRDARTRKSKKVEIMILRKGIASVAISWLIVIAASPVFAQPLEKIRIAYGARGIPFLSTFLAKELGFYERHGLQDGTLPAA
jgi:hypothetical protein